jgi:DNA/RNA endonuclease YhcR with UshA esterase domain
MKVKTIILYTLLLGFSKIGFSGIQPLADTVTAIEASEKIGEMVIVKAKVVTVFYAKNSTGKPTFLNLVYPFPDNPIAVIIFEDDLKRLKIDAQIYKGKTIIVKGKVKYYKDEEEPYNDKASITIYNKNQLEILENE